MLTRSSLAHADYLQATLTRSFLALAHYVYVKQLKKQAKMPGQKVKLPDEGFQKYGKTHFLSKKHADFGCCFWPKKNFVLVDRQMGV